MMVNKKIKNPCVAFCFRSNPVTLMQKRIDLVPIGEDFFPENQWFCLFYDSLSVIRQSLQR